MDITIKIAPQRIADLMTSAIEGKHMTRAWCAGVFVRGAKAKNAPDLWYADATLYDGDFTIEIREIPDESKPEKTKAHRVNAADLAAGFALMATKYGRHFGDFMAENEDNVTADVFLQCVALRDLVYG